MTTLKELEPRVAEIEAALPKISEMLEKLYTKLFPPQIEPAAPAGDPDPKVRETAQNPAGFKQTYEG